MKKFILTMLIAALFITGRAYSQSYPEMITVEGGTFTMGYEGMNTGYIEKFPAHIITLSGFKIAKTETTVAQYRIFCNETAHPMPTKSEYSMGDDNEPIVRVSWYDAVDYCNWLSKKTGQKYRLPTEAEWEYVARGGKKNKGYKYSGSNELCKVTNLNCENFTYKYTLSVVGQFKPNDLGIYNMTGNASEWCNDWFDKEYYKNSPLNNPKGPDYGDMRVVRGGGNDYYDYKNSGQVFYRQCNDPNKFLEFHGFRIACDL